MQTKALSDAKIEQLVAESKHDAEKSSAVQRESCAATRTMFEDFMQTEYLHDKASSGTATASKAKATAGTKKI